MDINKLPLEVLECILMKIDNLKDLLSCRFVSKIWKNISTRASRRRYTRLSIGRYLQLPNHEILDKLCLTFRGNGTNFDADGLPWSALRLPFCGFGQCSNGITPTLDQFLGLFANNIKKLTVVCIPFGITIKILQRMPNIEAIICKTDTQFTISNKEPKEDEVIPPGTKLVLNKLKLFQMEIRFGKSLPFFQMVLASSVRLKHVHVDYCDWTGSVAETLVTYLRDRDLPSISIKFYCECTALLLPFANSKLKIRKLSVQFQPGKSRNPTDVSPLEKLLASVSSFLEDFSLYCYRDLRTIDAKMLKFPIMPKVQRAKFSHTVIPNQHVSFMQPHNFTDELQSSFDFLCPITWNEFPVLQEVDIEGFGAITLFEGAEINTVKVLKIVECRLFCPMTTRWNTVFPNLRKLTASVCSTSLKYIFGELRNLEYLSLDLSHVEDDVNVLLTGIETPDEFLGKQEEEISSYRELNQIPSLLFFIDLRKLVLKFSRVNPLRESGVEFALIKIRPLDILKLEGIEISHTTSTKLSSHHNRFETYLRKQD